jgi:hypothetical protein
MTTDQATAKLADILRTGDADTKAERVAERNIWERYRHVEEENWSRADYSLEAAYHALGAEPPAVMADEWAQEKHPAQVEADRRWREEFEEE